MYPLESALLSDLFDCISIYTDTTNIEKTININLLNKLDLNNIEILYEKKTCQEKRTLSNVVYDYLSDKKITKGNLCLILPTAVFVRSTDIKEMKEKMGLYKRCFYGKKIDKKAVYAYVENEIISEKFINTLSEYIPDTFIDSGQAYWIDIEDFLKNPIILTNKAFAYYKNDTIDINTNKEFLQAKKLFKKTFGL